MTAAEEIAEQIERGVSQMFLRGLLVMAIKDADAAMAAIMFAEDIAQKRRRAKAVLEILTRPA